MGIAADVRWGIRQLVLGAMDKRSRLCWWDLLCFSCVGQTLVYCATIYGIGTLATVAMRKKFAWDDTCNTIILTAPLAKEEIVRGET